MRLKSLQFVLSIILSLVLFGGIVLAQQHPPHLLYGSVIYNGQPAPDGLSVIAKIDDKPVESTTTRNGNFGYSPLVFYVQGNAEDVIHLFVNDIDTGRTVDFCDSCFNDCGWPNDNCPPIVLSVTGPVLTTTTTLGGGGGGGNGGTTTTTIPTTTTIVTQTTVQECEEKWTCTDWSPCENNVQNRTCTDQNSCGTDLKKPYESQPCVVEEEEEETLSITGLITITYTQAIIGLIVVVLIIVVILGWRRIFRKKSTPINELSLTVY